MPSYPSKIIFPSWALEDVQVEDAFNTTIIQSLGGEAANANWSRSRFVINLSGARLTAHGRREIKAINRLLQGRRHLCWYRRYDDPEWELKDEYLGTGDGVKTTFQARVFDRQQERDVWLDVFALDHDLPEMGLDPYNVPYTKTRMVEVRVDGVLKTLGVDYTVQREGGKIVFTAPVAVGAKVTLTGGFFAVVRLTQESIPTTPAGGGWWKLPDNIGLVEPKNANAGG
jgi:hypothetical protein